MRNWLKRHKIKKTKNFIWFLEAITSVDGKQTKLQGTAIAIRLRNIETKVASTYLLTCGHNIRLNRTGPVSSEIFAYKQGSGYTDTASYKVDVLTEIIPYTNFDPKAAIPEDFLENGWDALDWVLLRFESENTANQVKAIDSCSNDISSKVDIYGYPDGSGSFGKSSTINATCSPEISVHDGSEAVFKLVSNNTRKGMSGGGVFNSNTSAFVGIHRSRAQEKLTLSGISFSHITKVINEQWYDVITENKEGKFSLGWLWWLLILFGISIGAAKYINVHNCDISIKSAYIQIDRKTVDVVLKKCPTNHPKIPNIKEKLVFKECDDFINEEIEKYIDIIRNEKADNNAEDIVNRAASRCPAHPKSYRIKGQFQFYRKQYKSAVEHLKEARRVAYSLGVKDTHYFGYELDLADALLDGGSVIEAIVIYRDLLRKIDKKDIEDKKNKIILIKYKLGRAYVIDDEPDQAISLLEEFQFGDSRNFINKSEYSVASKAIMYLAAARSMSGFNDEPLKLIENAIAVSHGAAVHSPSKKSLCEILKYENEYMNQDIHESHYNAVNILREKVGKDQIMLLCKEKVI